jgi:hypothetical protein
MIFKGDWYSFQKPSRMRSDVSLDKIDGDFDHQERLKRKKRSLLKQIKKGFIFIFSYFICFYVLMFSIKSK